MSGDWLAPELTRLALCWRVERRDGIAIGFTGHDRDLEIGGLRYRSAPGIGASAVTRGSGFDVSTLDVSGALSHAAITDADLADGRWDGAQAWLFAVDWGDPSDPVPLARGELGVVEQRDGGFAAELRGPTAVLEAQGVEATSPDCRAELGDRRCRVDMAGRRRIVRLLETDADGRLRVDASEPGANGYGYGRLRWITGRGSGLEAGIARSDGEWLELREPLAFVPEPGALVELIEGCDRTLATCAGRFGNAANFRGEPHLPGTDLLTRYPGA